MLKCTYIVLIYNNESNIAKLVNSLKKIDGNFHKEFIFVDDGSTDNSLNLLKVEVNDIPKTTIITQEVQGSTISVNKAISLVTGDYIHFVEGDEILQVDSTSILMESCLKLGTEVAIGLVSRNNSTGVRSKRICRIIENPMNEILTKKLSPLRNIGRSGSMVHSELLDKIGKADSSIYTHNMSLSLRCAKYSKFAFIEENITNIADRDLSYDSKFNSYNNLKSIYNFSKENPEIFSKLIPELLAALSSESLKKYDKINFYMKSLTSKYFKPVALNDVLTLYRHEIEKLF